MGHATVLVIGSDAKDQLDKFQRAEYADPKSRHFVLVDRLERAKIEYSVGTRRLLRHADGTLHDPYAAEFWRPLPNGGKQLYVPENYIEVKIPLQEMVSFQDWVTNGVSVIAEGQEPDTDGMNKLGWIRVNASGEVVEMMERTIPGGFYDWFEGTDNSWKLKRGAVGRVIRRSWYDWIEEPATNGYAGSARKGDIDLDGMRAQIHKAAADWWDCAARASGSKKWEPFDVVQERYRTEEYSAALKEWAAQPASAAIIAALHLNPELHPHFAGSGHPEIDLLRLPQNEYLERHGLRFLLQYDDVIQDGELLGDPAEGQLYDSIPEDAVLTLANVHC